MTPNNRMQRAGTHKVPRRGRDRVPRKIFMLARVPTSRRAGADAERSATLPLCSAEWHYSITVCAQNS
jgi:hypothetical protein